MDFSYHFQGIDFEWNAEKASLNLKNHKVSFETACEVFFDPFLQVEDAGTVENEAREAVVGLTLSWKLLYVVYIMRDEKLRIISARLATKEEKRNYEYRKAKNAIE